MAKPLMRDAGWRAVTAAFALNGLLFGAWASRVPAFKEGFGMDPGTLGLLLLALAGGAIMSFPFAGALSERWGADRLTVKCAWAYPPSLVFLALAPNIFFLGAALFAFGAFHGAMDVAMNSWGARIEKRLGRSTMSVFHAMFSLGAGIGALSGYIAAKFGVNLASHFSLVSIVGGTLGMFMMVPAQETRVILANTTNPKPILTLPSASLFAVGMIAFCVAIGEGAMADWSAVFLRSMLEASEAEAALGFAAFSTMMVLTRFSGGFIVQGLGPIVTTRLSGGLACIGLLVVVGADTLSPALLGFSLVGVGYAVVMPLVFSRAANDPIVLPGPAIASIATLGYGGMLLGPPAVGFMAQILNLRISFGALALLAIIVILLAPKLRVQN